MSVSEFKKLRSVFLDKESELEDNEELQRHLLNFARSQTNSNPDTQPPFPLWDLSPIRKSRLSQKDSVTNVLVVHASSGECGSVLFRLQIGRK